MEKKTTVDELKSLVKYIDQLAFLYYDTQINSQKIFENNCASLIKDIGILKAQRNIQYMIAIGTFINEPALQKYRNLEIESISNSLQTIRAQINKVDPTRKLVDGIALFCDWETDKDEWQQFDDNWSKYTKK